MADFDPKAFLAEDTSFDPKAFLGIKEEKPIQQLSDKEIVEKMKFWKPENRAALLKEAERLGPVKADLLAAPMRFALSVAKIPAGIAKLAGYEKPAELISQADIAAKEFSGPKEGFMGSRGPVSTAASLGGDIYGAAGLLKGIGAAAKPLAAAAPVTAPAISAVSKSPLSQSVLGGAALGAVQAPTNAPLDVLQSTAMGAGAGGVGHGLVAGAGRVLSPQLERLSQIKEKGFNVPEFIKESSVGQFFGGVPQKIENFMTNIPFSGTIPRVEAGAKSIAEQAKALRSQADVQRNLASQGLSQTGAAAATQRAELLKQQQLNLDERLKQHVANLNANVDKKYADFSTNMINRALEPIGAKLEPGVKGTEAIKFAQNKVDEAYKAALPKIGDVRIGDEQKAALRKIVEDNKRKLGGENSEYYNKFAADVDDIIAKVGDSNLISANQWHNIFKDVGADAFKNKGFGVKGTQAEYGDALTKLKNTWMDMIEGTPGADLIKQANSAYSALQVPQTAAGYLKTYSEKGGEFDPKDFLRALKSEASRKKFSAGEARLQDEALSVFEQMAKDKANVKAQEAAFKQQLTGKKAEQKSAMKAENVQAAKNIANQKAYLEMLASQEQKPGITKLAEEIAYKPSDRYAEKRIGYTAAGLGGGHYLGNLLGITPEQQMLGAGAMLGTTNLLNLGPVQNLIKQAATAERPEVVKRLGQQLQNLAVPSSLVGTKSYMDERALERERNKSKALPVPMAAGGPIIGLAEPQGTTSIAPTQATPFVDTRYDERSVPGVMEPPFNPTPSLYGQGPTFQTNDGGSVTQMFGGMPQQDNNVFAQNTMNPTVANQPMPRLKQFVPQAQQFVTPRRPTGGGMPTYMQNNAAYEAQRQRIGPYTAFPNANQIMPQRRVVPRRGVPIARMAEGGPVKK